MRLTLLLLTAVTLPLAAQSDRPTTATAAAARLRSLWYDQAYIDGMNEGFALARQFARSPEVRAWFIINYSTSGFSDQAIDSANALSKQFPTSPWANAARAYTIADDFDRGAEAMPLARRAYRASPASFDLALINAYVLSRYGEFPHGIAFIDSVNTRFPSNPELLAYKGELLMMQSRRPNADPSVTTRAREAFLGAQRIAPNNVNAWYRAATSLESARGDTATYRMLRRAAELSPHSSRIHSRYWSSIQSRSDVSDSAKRVEAEADIARFLEGRENVVGFLYVVSGGYGTLKMADRQRELTDRVERDFPSSRYAEMVVYDRLMSRERREIADTAAARVEHRRQIKEFIARPYHYSKSSLGTAYLDLFSSLRSDSTTSNADLLAAIRGSVEYNTINPQWTHYDMPLLLASRKLDVALATKLANESTAKWKTQLDGMAAYASTGEMADRRALITAQKYDMLGWIDFNQGRLNDAQRRLEQARELSNQSSMFYYHLGRVAEAQGRSVDAEQMFARGYQLETSGFGRRVENTTELKRLYAARNKSLDGFDAYVERLKEEDRVRRRAKIADTRLKEPKALPSFSLERLSLDGTAVGERVTAQSLRGKFAVINFWGVWCGPCVAEMPELQKFHERIKSDTSIVFVTIDYNDERQTVKDWMVKRKFTMPVLLDDGFVKTKARILAYPTTWFVDREGNIVFSHSGASDVVAEEFGWRVEMLKAAAKTVP
jgi:thiol-disulfide isomerase/thioredoxin